ncbi:hypothetical protein BCY86_02785 [Pajaroellobacter abortibovis]|uniref:Uncharacterized protein n=2 Tax=Pajaroellobacter abortibovis TaxID=1882918 RepID=A0A1L6MW16_9BACT|nr:hypothetical protein BCY86_02785 [Pajaroellobacter abortibovis]
MVFLTVSCRAFAALCCGLITFGWVFFFFCAVFPLDLLREIGDIASKGGASIDQERRLFTSRLLGVASFSIALGLSGVALSNGLRSVQVKRVRVTLSELSSRLSGDRIVQLSGIHVGLLIGKDFVEQLIDQVNGLNPDLLAIVGGFGRWVG